MPETRSRYRGHEIVSDDATPSLTIDAQVVPVSRIAPNLYATILLPQSNYSSLDEIARAVIDHSPQFSGRRDLH